MNFSKDENADIRAKFEYCRRAGIGVIVAGDPTPATLPRLERFVKEYDHQAGHPQSRPGGRSLEVSAGCT